MPQLSALLVTIKRRANGRAQYPGFNALPVVQASGMDWSRYVDTEGEGWLFDRTSGHDDDDKHSPLGQQLGLLLVTAQFASEAVEQFADSCTRLSEQEARAFYDQRFAAGEAEDRVENAALESLDRRLRLLREAKQFVQGFQEKERALLSRVAEALDPENRARGVRDNPKSSWAKFKSKKQIIFVGPS